MIRCSMNSWKHASTDENDRRVEVINITKMKESHHKLEERLEEELSRLKELREELKRVR